MRSTRGIIALLAVGCLVAIGAVLQSWRFDTQVAAQAAAADRISRQYTAIELTLGDMRASQAGYVAVGQGADFWTQKVDELTTQLEDLLRARQQQATYDAVPQLDSAIALLEPFRTSDRRARNYVRNDQRLLASDVVYVESLEVLNKVSADVVAAREAELFVARQEIATLTQFRQALGGAAVLVLVVIALVLGRRPKLEFPAVDSIAPAPAATTPSVATSATPAAAPAPMLGDMADVCVDLGRLLDGRDLPALLTRTAGTIGAKGLVLWVIDEPREQLRATLGHGYSDRMIQRLGALPVATENVTAQAFRTLQAQRVPASATDATGAIAVPLITPTGCVGVLAAELTSGHQLDTAVALTRIIAAQLASVITPLPAAGAPALPSAADAR
jgi:hypothetical protein